jgi:xylose isomerase
MQVSKEKLKNLETAYQGYLEGEKLDKFFKEFGIKFAAGHWCAGDFCDRFAPAGYNSDNPNFKSDIISQIKRVAEAGIEGIEFHEALFIDKNFKIDKEKIEQTKKALKENNLTPTNMNTNLFGDPYWKLGGFTNPDPEKRKEAIRVALQGLEIATMIGCSSASIWPGSDGWDYNFEVNYGDQMNLFVEACIKVNKRAKELGLKYGIEAKLKEPREGNMVVPTTHLAALIAKTVNEACGGKNMGVCIDYGHEQMYGVEPASLLYVLKYFGVPIANFHLNTAKYHSNDEDRVTGTGDLWKLIEFCYAAIDTNYDGWFGEDQFTYRMDPVKAMSLSKEIFGNAFKKALLIYKEKDKLEKAQKTGDAGNTIDVVKKIILNG